MKKPLIILLLVSFSMSVKSQVDDRGNIDFKNLRTDTITTYFFNNNNQIITKIQNTKPTSNFGFKTSSFNLNWIPIYTLNIDRFIRFSLDSNMKNLSPDSINCKIFGQDYIVKCIDPKKGKKFFIYQRKVGNQDFFLLKLKKKSNKQKAINFIEDNLKL